jgi:hypothetical protein
MPPAGPRGGASTAIVRSCAHGDAHHRPLPPVRGATRAARDRPGSCAHATRAAASVPSRHGRRETRLDRPPRRRREPLIFDASLPLPSVLPGSSRDPGQETCSPAAHALGASSDLADVSVTQPSMRCTQWPSRRRARSASAVTSCCAMRFPRMLPAGSRGGASTAIVRLRRRAPGVSTSAGPRERAITRVCAHATRAAASAPSRHGRRDTRLDRPPRRRREPRVFDVSSPLPSVLPDVLRAMEETPARCTLALGRELRSRRRATLDAMHAVVVTPPSTVGERRDFVLRDEVLANAPGRIEGRCEHRDRAVVRSRDDAHHGLCLPSEGATTAPRPRDRALTRHGHRRLPRRAMADARLASTVLRVADANHWVCRASCLSPRSCRGLRTILERILDEPAHAALAPSASSDLGDVSVTQPSMRCTQWPSRRRARSASIVTSCCAMRFSRMLPAGSRGGASTASVRSCAHETTRTTA